ncbi:hypothetical protein BD309DRAFT_992596 [Dichomitus squalens]|uniref:Nephrocystin 3-like N-terminal domain-containing protein n=1 Tax=Dichomitus squalens TaxID=114155 RepID=A0A4Q9Q3E2_9APHY|nr:hypothetical protein BD309DRAFT_992596 [Dichomitus squalens]TBU61541.1 hypothetical protein BD310DRAFT_813223 [Dichomitus squalens]
MNDFLRVDLSPDEKTESAALSGKAPEGEIEETMEETGQATTGDDVYSMNSDSENDSGMDVDDTILEALPHADADYRAPIHTLRNYVLSGTRLELLEDLHTWAYDSPSSRSICILNGALGTGKSSIASNFARLLRDNGHLGASFFFVRGVDNLASTKLFFPTLAYQLSHTQNALRPHIVAAVQDYLKLGRAQDIEHQGEHLLRRPLLAAQGQDAPVVIVIDAVDECADDSSDLSTVLRLLLTCVCEVTFPLRILLTSVPERIVDTSLSSHASAVTLRRLSLHNLSRDSINRDIAIFIRDRLSRMSSSKDLAEQPDLADRLALRADGLFVYARAAMDFLHDKQDELEQRLDLILSATPSGLGTLDALYLTILEHVIPPARMEQQPTFRASVQSILGCIPVLRDPISPRTLESLIHIPCKDSLPILHQLRCTILVNRNDLDEPFRPGHATFVQFLLSSARCPNRLYLVDAKRQNAQLAEGCLRVLLTLDRNICRLQDPSMRKADVVDLAERVRTHVPPHAQYACLHWAVHLRGACKVGDAHSVKGCRCGELVDLLKTWATTKMLVWLETLGYLGRLDLAVSGLTAGCDYLGTRHSKTRSALEQGLRLLSDHLHEIEACPDDVYLCGIRQDGYNSDDEELKRPLAQVNRKGKNLKIGLF